MPFSALYLTSSPAGVQADLVQLEEAGLPEGDLLIEVSHSSLNYKDAVALTRGAPVVRRFPLVPGIDLVGVVRESSAERVRPGDHVLVNGHGLGEERWGGLAELARVPADYVTPLPDGLSPADAMALGTAGYTAALCLLALERGGLTPAAGDVLVTGATGGVGSIAVALLAAGVIVSSPRPVAATRSRISNLSVPRRSLTARSWLRRASPCERSVGPRSLTVLAATRWPTPVRERSVGDSLPRAGWRRASTFLPPWRRSSFAALRFTASTASGRRRPAAGPPGNGWPAKSTATSFA